MGWNTGVRFPAEEGKELLPFTTAFKVVLLPTQPPIQCVARALFPKVKRPGRVPDHSHPSNVKDRNVWGYNSTPPYVHMV
jgi:hypothetical protein